MNHKIKAILWYWILVCLLVFGRGTPALCEAESDHEHGHDHAVHGASAWELGLSTGYVYLRTEKEDAAGLHLHLMRRLGQEGPGKYVSLGAGVETIFATHEHYSLMGSVGIHPWRDLVLQISPGVQWVKHEGEWESEYATHLEAAYVFPINRRFHLGPVIGYSKTRHDEHTMIGVHLGIHLGH